MAEETPREEASQGSGEEPRIVNCPQCSSPAIIADEGTTLPGVGFCGHEYLFKMVKLHCTMGHNFDVLDEENSVHSPDECMAVTSE